jgi:hypothetical protein
VTRRSDSIARETGSGKDLLTIQFTENFNEFGLGQRGTPALNQTEHLT